jgi:uncharacterized protein YjbI with pentapeptide repeats
MAGANLTGAVVRGAIFGSTTSKGFSAGQLYSTASYQAHDLQGIRLLSNDLTGWNFAGQNLTSADFSSATLTGADFSQANITSASFSSATLTGADLSGADVRGANFDLATYRGFTAAQLYSTASYQAHDLTGIRLRSNDLTSWNFAGQNLTKALFSSSNLTDADLSQANLTNASFSSATFTGANLSHANLTYASFVLATLTGADLSHANLTNAYFSSYAGTTGADLTAADTRGAQGLGLSGVTTTNLIHPDGRIVGVDLHADALVIRDYDGNPFPTPPTAPIPITVDQQFAIGAGGTLRMVFEEDAWDSTISFEAGIPVTLGGTLELTFADDLNRASQVGRTFRLFDWTGIAHSGQFTVASNYTWNLSSLYSTGEVTLTAIPEPSALALTAFGILCLLISRRRSTS